MRLRQYQVDAFTQTAFAGNPAAVIKTDTALPLELMQQLAAENNLAETAFVVPQGDYWSIRWFTPTTEVPLCGHATLAAAWVLLTEYAVQQRPLVFSCQSGELKVELHADRLTLDFPAIAVEPIEPPPLLVEAIPAVFLDVVRVPGDWGNYLLRLENQKAVQSLQPNWQALRQIDDGGVIVTAAGEAVDVVSRYFAPCVGIDEDPVTGSAHCVLTPYWTKLLGKKQFSARQLSARGGAIDCELVQDRVRLSGYAVTVQQAEWRLSL